MDFLVFALKTPLKDCSKCSLPQVGILLSVYVILGILSIFGNGLVLRNVLTKQKGFEDMFSKIRASLAFADLLTGKYFRQKNCVCI